MKHFIKKLLQPRHLEYLELSQDLQILDMSSGAKALADDPDRVKPGSDVRLGFPELFGAEEILQNILKENQENFEIKGIDRSPESKNPLYIDLYAIAYSDDDRENNRLIVLVENVTDRMVMAQNLVQQHHETKLLYNSLKNAKSYIDQIISSMADVLLVTNTNGEIQTINQTTQNLFNYQAEELIGQPFLIIIPDRTFLPDWRPQTSINQKIFQDREFIGKTKQGQDITLSFSCSWMQRTPHDTPEFVYIGRDITARKQAEQALEYAKREAEMASQIKSQFLANMSHEIRTPMNAILGMAELLLMTPLTAEQRDFAETINSSGESLLRLINEILDLSKLEAGQMNLELLDVNLDILLENILELLAPIAHKKLVEIILLIDEDVPANLQGDPSRLQQIFTNLLSNAIKFTEEGEVCIQVELEAETETTAMLYFSVTDTGIGMDSDDIGKLFKPFYQLDGSSTRKYGGTGLGLAICKQLVTIMGGEIGVSSQLNQGSNFWLRIPFPKQTYPQTLVKITSPLKERHILVVDDNANHRRMIRNLMANWQVKITEADSATAGNALEKLLNNSSRPIYDLALIDIPMSESDGLKFVQKIRQSPIFSSIPLVLMRSSQQRQIAKQALDLGWAAVLVKPVKSSRMFEEITRVLDSSSPTEVKPSELRILTKLSEQQTQAHSLKILLAEDNTVNQKVALKLLKNLGYHADAVKNGAEVIQRLEEMSYDVILMDCQMPVLDGYQATQEILRRWGGAVGEGKNAIRRPVVIALTANAMKQDKQKCLAAGMDDFMTKPVRLEQLRAILSHWTQKLLDRSKA